MVVGERRRLIAPLVTASLAVLLWVTVTSERGCASPSSSPVAAARAFIQAARGGDKQAVWDWLGPKTRQSLHQAAKRATETVGGARRFTALDLLDVTPQETPYRGAEVTLRQGNLTRTVVDVVGPSGQRDSMELVHEGGMWRVELGFGDGSHQN